MARRRKDKNGGIITSIIAMLILYGIIQYVAPVLIPIAVGFGVLFMGAFLVSVFGPKTEKAIPAETSSTSGGQIMLDVLREVEILKDCQNLINESRNLETVAYRYNLLVEKLNIFAGFTESELNGIGLPFGKSPNEYLNYINDMKATILCQAIDRAGEKCREHVRTLSTEKGRKKALERFYISSCEIIAKYDWASPACVNRLNEIRQSIQDEFDISEEIIYDGDFDFEPGYSYVSVSTSGDNSVCQMCKQFEGKLFRTKDAPHLPLHPMCGCAYMYHETPGRKKIRNPADFVWPAECTLQFCVNADAIVRERNIHNRVQLCAEGLELLKDFLTPYREAKWPPPEELPCVYWSIHDYMALGEWEKAEETVNICVDAGAFSTDEGIEQLKKVRQTADASSATLRFLSENPGTFQRNIYRKLCPPCDREALKWFVANSVQIRKEKTEKTNRLFVAEKE